MPPVTIDPARISTEPHSDSFHSWGPIRYFSPNFKECVSSRLKQLNQLEPNWDCEGATAINRHVIAAADRLAQRLPDHIIFPPAVVPISNGTLQFEWNADDYSLEFEFESPGEIRYLKWDPEKGVEEEDSFPANDVDQATALIEWFTSRMFN